MEGITVLKARLEQNRMMAGWLATHGVRITALPTLVLMRNGKPVRTLFGADKILKQSSLHSFAFDAKTSEPAQPVAATEAPPAQGEGLFARLGSFIGFAF